jgi:hypothetical protein
MAKEVMAKRVMANDMMYVDSVGVPGGKDVPITDQPKSSGGSGLTLTIVIAICVILGIVSGIFFAKRSALK